MKQISHYGKVINIKNNKLQVQITRYSACHNCDARHGCGLMDCQNKIIDIETDKIKTFKIGDDVLINMEQNQATYAIILGYILPLIIMVSALIITYSLSSDQLKSGISAIIILIPYYLWLFLNRKRLAHKFRFTVSQIME